MSAPALSRENAVAAALAILDSEGAGALTMRRVARDIGVPLMSLYRHVRAKDDLEAAVVEALVVGVRPPRPTGEWETDLRAWAVAYRAMVMDHPNAAPLLAARPAVGYGARAADAEAMLRLLADAGLDDAAARIQFRTALVVITGFCHAQEAARVGGASAGTPAGPPSADTPLVAALIEDVRAGRHVDELFDTMLAAVVGGIATAVQRARAGR